MSEKTVLVDVSECQLSVQCGNCGTAVVFDPRQDAKARKDAEAQKGKHDKKALKECPRCGVLTGYDPDNDRDPLEMYRRFYAAAALPVMARDKDRRPAFTFLFLVPTRRRRTEGVKKKE